MTRQLIDDELWEIVEPLLPEAKPRRRRFPGRKPLDTQRHSLRTETWDCVGTAAAGDGLRIGHALLAASARMARSAEPAGGAGSQVDTGDTTRAHSRVVGCDPSPNTTFCPDLCGRCTSDSPPCSTADGAEPSEYSVILLYGVADRTFP